MQIGERLQQGHQKEEDWHIVEYNELDSMCGISDDELTERFKESIRIDNEIKKVKGVPIAGYDKEKKQAYLEYPDGRRKYAAGQ